MAEVVFLPRGLHVEYSAVTGEINKVIDNGVVLKKYKRKLLQMIKLYRLNERAPEETHAFITHLRNIGWLRKEYW